MIQVAEQGNISLLICLSMNFASCWVNMGYPNSLGIVAFADFLTQQHNITPYVPKFISIDKLAVNTLSRNQMQVNILFSYQAAIDYFCEIVISLNKIFSITLTCYHS